MQTPCILTIIMQSFVCEPHLKFVVFETSHHQCDIWTSFIHFQQRNRLGTKGLASFCTIQVTSGGYENYTLQAVHLITLPKCWAHGTKEKVSFIALNIKLTLEWQFISWWNICSKMTPQINHFPVLAMLARTLVLCLFLILK